MAVKLNNRSFEFAKRLVQGGKYERDGHYKFPYGDFEKAHRCGVRAA
jgi:hypothetical protein